MENNDCLNLVENIIQFNEIFHLFNNNVASTMESKTNNNFDAIENVKLLINCQKYIDNMINIMKSNQC